MKKWRWSMRSIHSRHYIYTHWLRIDLNNDERKQWEQLKDYWNKYDCSMTVYYYDYNPLTEKAINFISDNFDFDIIDCGNLISQKNWDTLYKKAMEPLCVFPIYKNS